MQSIVHIGMPRAASTWLQHRVFSRAISRRHLGRSNWKNRWLKDDSSPSFANQPLHDLLWTVICWSNQAEFEAFLAENLDQLRALLERSPYIVSQEMLLCPDYGKVLIDERLRRLAATFVGAKILLITRRQIDYLKSFHKIALKGLGMTLSQREYVSLYTDSKFLGYGGVLNYLDIRDRLVGLGFEVCWLPYELLLQNPAAFLAKLAEAMDGDLDHSAISPDPVNAGDTEDLDMLRWLYNRQHPHFLSGDLLSFPIAESFLHNVRDKSPLQNRINKETQRSAAAWNLKAERASENSRVLSTVDRVKWRSSAKLDSRLMALYAVSNRELDDASQTLAGFGYY